MIEVIPMAKITDEQEAEVLALHEDGLPRNEIARRTGISAGSVTRICQQNDRGFDRSSTKDATKAREADLAVARVDLAQRLNKAANDMLDMIDQPFKVYNFGGKDNTYAEHTLDSAPVDARRTIITSGAIVFDKISKVVEGAEDAGEASARSMLTQLGDMLGVS